MFVVEISAPRATEVDEPKLAGMKTLGAIDVSSSGQTILVAEDDPDLIALLSLFLQRGGYKLILANDGQEAIDVAIESNPDLVLMDVNMPKLDGLSAVRVLRSRGFTRPVVALTASLSANDRDQAFSWGCDGYLVKPISMPELLSAVGRYLDEAAE